MASSKARIRTAVRVLAVIAVILAIRAWQQRGTASGMAPAFEAPTLDGGSFSVQAQRGKPLLIHFWATWCGVCKMMDGNVAAMVPGHDVITVASWSGGADKVARTLRDRGLSMPVVVDPDGRIAREYGVSAVPASFVVGPDGRIRYTEVGYTTELGLRLRMWLAGH